jgi:tetratricopeptide (TPR) repeat protein
LNLEAIELYRSGRAFKSAGDAVGAERCYRQAVEQSPAYVDAWISLGILLRQSGRLEEAAQCQRTALGLSPGNTLAMINLGNTLNDLHEYQEAEALYRKVLQLQPQSAEAHRNLGSLLWRNLDMRAATHYYRALELKPDYVEAAFDLGQCLFRSSYFADAARAYELACRLQPTNIDFRLAHAAALLAARDFATAQERYEHLLQSVPGHPRALAGLGATLAGIGQYDQPLALLREAIDKSPDDPWIQGHLAQLLLRGGEYADAWKYYDYRWQAEETRKGMERGFAPAKWNGESLTGRHLLLISEQGLGDEIMFASVFAEAIAQAAHCLIECDERLTGLFRRSFPSATFFGVRKSAERGWFRKLGEALPNLPPFDCWTAAGSWAGSQRRRAAQFPRHKGYLQADPVRVARWRARLEELGPGRCIGLSWRGGTVATNRDARSLQLEQLRPLLETGATHFISLQYGDCAAEVLGFTSASGIAVHHWPEALEDYEETAALIMALDLTISVCTAVVHLAGALGRPVWVLAPQVAEWRYGRDGTTMIWYPSVTLFRQNQDNAWAPVVSQVQQALAALPVSRLSTAVDSVTA